MRNASLAICGSCLSDYESSLTSIDSQRPGIQPKLEALKALYEGKKIIVGRDKLDVVKGVLQKVRILASQRSR